MKGNGQVADGKHTQVAIGDEAGKVVMAFDRELSKLVLDPENARQIGEAMARAAYTARFGSAPDGSAIAAGIKERTRDRLIHRFVLVNRSLLEQGKSPDFIARQLVDIFLSEVA